MTVNDLMKNLMKHLLVLAGMLALASPAAAQLRIEIVEGSASQLPIAVVPFGWRMGQPNTESDVAEVVSADLHRSGLFDPMDVADMPDRPTSGEQVRFGTWRLLQVDYIVVGEVRPAPDGIGYDIAYQLYDVHTQENLLSQITSVGPGDLRFGAHRVADAIYERLTGVPGAFSTRMAFIKATGTGDDARYELVVADADGWGEQPVVGSPEPLLSPAWSPDGQKLAYVSFENGNSSVWIQDVATGAREQISAGRGINGAPSFSPDGRQLAMVLSRTGNPEIVVRDLASGQNRQLTEHWAIDTEPVWSPDGQYIYFTSDRGGKPQIYRVPPRGGSVERVTLEGEYNARASVSPDGKKLAVAHGMGNTYRIALWDLEQKHFTLLTPGTMDESPSFAPNGAMVLYATRDGQRGVLSSVSADGNVRVRLILSEGDVREPAWSPVIR